MFNLEWRLTFKVMRKQLKLFILVLCIGTFASVQKCFAQFRYYEKGYDFYTSGKFTEAIKSFTEYLTKGVRDRALDTEVYYLRGLSYYKTGQFSLASVDFEEAILLNHLNKGNIYWFKAKAHVEMKEYDNALLSYSGALREFQKDASVSAKLYLERSQVNAQKGDQKQALHDLQAGRTLDSANEQIKQEIARYEKNGVVMPSYEKQEEKVEVKNTEIASRGNDQKTNKPVNPDVSKVEVKEETSIEAQKSPIKSLKSTKEVSAKTQQQNPPKVDPNQQKKTQTTQPVVVQPTSTTTSTLFDLYKDEKRYALVIGNAAYPKTIGALKNAVNDASDIAKELRGSGFEVDLLLNATYGQMRAALLKFKEKVDGSEKDKAVALFYFAGHGVQFEDENYLVPIDAQVQFTDDIPRYCFPTQRMVLSNMERSNARMNIVILDACRNNPFPAVSRSVAQGLGEMRRAKGSFIAYATAPGSVASDGTGRNGLYTQELLKAMRKPGLTIEQVFKEVRANVLRLSNDRQNTWDSSNIIGEFYFKF
jgi:tetratricopeptide (TPR) repeat protein